MNRRKFLTHSTLAFPALALAASSWSAEKAPAHRFIVAHADGHGLHFNQQIADLGAWVSFDAISRQPLELHLKLVAAMLEKHAHRLLLSHDNGWYWVGQRNGGEVRDYNHLADTFLPALRKTGVTDPIIQQLTAQNPARAIQL